MNAATARTPIHSPGPERSGEWESFTAGMIIQCPGFNHTRQRACSTGMGQVANGRRILVRVKQAKVDPRTDIVRLCRRCHQHIEQRTEVIGSSA